MTRPKLLSHLAPVRGAVGFWVLLISGCSADSSQQDPLAPFEAALEASAPGEYSSWKVAESALQVARESAGAQAISARRSAIEKAANIAAELEAAEQNRQRAASRVNAANQRVDDARRRLEREINRDARGLIRQTNYLRATEADRIAVERYEDRRSEADQEPDGDLRQSKVHSAWVALSRDLRGAVDPAVESTLAELALAISRGEADADAAAVEVSTTVADLERLRELNASADRAAQQSLTPAIAVFEDAERAWNQALNRLVLRAGAAWDAYATAKQQLSSGPDP